METIVETLGDYGSQVKDTDMLTEYVRQALKRTISRRFSEAGQMKVISLDDRIENHDYVVREEDGYRLLSALDLRPSRA